MKVTMENVQDVYPLSPMQEGMLFHTLSEKGTGVYVIQTGYSLSGGLEIEHFESAWRTVIDRHEILRTFFLWEDLKRPVQMVRPDVELPLEQLDWRGTPAVEQERRLERLMAEDRIRSFELTRAPLLRLTLVRREDDLHFCLVSIHHILIDGWCMQQILGEAAAFYQAACDGRELSLGRPRPYRDFIVWLERQDLAEAEVFWRRQLEGFSSPTPLVIDELSPDPAGGRTGMGELARWCSESLSAALVRTARSQRLTLSTLLQGAWAILLSRYSGEREVLFGLTVSGRPADLEGTDSMVGLFLNTLPLRTDVPRRARLSAWLRALQERAAEMREYEFARLMQIQGWSPLGSGAPLFETVLVFQNFPTLAPRDPDGGSAAPARGARLGMAEVRTTQSGNYPLGMLIDPGSRWKLRALYNRARIPDTAVLRLLGHLRALLESIVDGPDSTLESLTMATAPERHQVLCEWNATSADPPRPVTVERIIEERAVRGGESVAVAFEEQRLSYGALDRLSGRLADELVALGVGPESPVGLCMERSLDVVVGLLAILKTGGVYLPLDPALPRERWELMVRDSGLAVLLTQERLRDRFSGAPVEMVCVDRFPSLGGEALAGGAPGGVPCRARAANLAYAIYTSGSTGKPKGVLLSHRGLCHLTTVQRARFGFQPGSHVLQFSSLSFDASVFEIAVGLACGATIHLADHESLAPGPPLARFVSERAISWMVLPPSVLAALPEEDFPALATLAVAGEACSAEIASRWAPGRRMINAYGPTEATIWVTASRCSGDGSRPLIGRPVEHTRAYVADSRLRSVPPTVAGELLLGGIGLARGYLRRPALTAERFVPDPWGDEPGERLYRTSDLARHLPDGEIDFLGRIDQQVKILGHRIEPGEIESALLRFPPIRDAAVVARRDVPGARGDQRLVAYAVAEGGPLSPQDVHLFLAERLPAYMIPRAFVELEAMPLTASGKVDRAALPAPQLEVRGDVSEDTAPRNAIEEALAAIWIQVLNVETVGIEDSFFDLGGDSILSLQIVARAKEAGLVLTHRQVFEYPTIAALAAVVQAGKTPVAEQDEVTGTVPLTPAQHALFEGDPERPWHRNRARWFEVDGTLGPARLEQAVDALLAHHDALRLRWPPAGGFWRKQQQGRQVPVTKLTGSSFARVDLSRLPEEERARALEAGAGQAQGSLRLEEGPVFRAVLFSLGQGSTDRLLLVAHRLVADRRSWVILARDLATACERLRGGRPPRLPRKTTSFKYASETLGQFARSRFLAQELDVWLAASRRPIHPLPVDRDNGDDTYAGEHRVSLSLNEQETEDLLQRVPQAYRTETWEILLAALTRVIAEWSGGRSMWVALESPGREEVDPGLDLERTVGCFATDYPVLLEMPDGGGEGETLKVVKERLRTVPFHGMGYGLFYYLASEKASGQLRAQPAPQVRFSYEEAPVGTWPPASGLRLLRNSAGPEISPAARRPYLLEVTAEVVDGCLCVDWIYGARRYRRATLELLAERFLAALRSLMEHCLDPAAGSFTPSDFPRARLSQQSLDDLVAEIAEADEK